MNMLQHLESTVLLNYTYKPPFENSGYTPERKKVLFHNWSSIKPFRLINVGIECTPRVVTRRLMSFSGPFDKDGA